MGGVVPGALAAGIVPAGDGAVAVDPPSDALGGVPRVVAVLPGQFPLEGLADVKEGPGNDDVVVDACDARNDHHTQSHTCV